MSVYKKNGRFYIKGRIKKMDGSILNYNRLAYNAQNLKEARNYEVDFLRKYQDIEISKTSLTFKELCDEYFKQYNNVKTSSKYKKEKALKRACDTFGDKKINLITVEQLRSFITDIEHNFSDKYADTIYYGVKNVFDYAVYQNYIQVNPMNRVKRTVNKDKITKSMNFWEQEEFDKFMEYIDDLQEKTIFNFLYYMGTRKGEMRALQWKDIDFKTNTVNIYKTATATAKGIDGCTAPKTKNSNRNISMPVVVSECLKEWKETQTKIYGFNEDCFVFGFYRPLPPENLRRWLKEGIKTANENGANLSEIRIHDFRHSHASYLINNMSDKFTDFDIAKRLGDTVQTLHDTYAHWFKKADRGIIEFMNANTSECTKKAVGADSVDDEYTKLKKLKELFDMGILTEEEFYLKKKQILNI